MSRRVHGAECVSEARVRKLWSELSRILRLSHLYVTFLPENDDEIEFATERSNRGREDLNAFNVSYDVKRITEMTDEQVISGLIHEWLHMALFDAYEAGRDGRKKATETKYTDSHESGVHALERAIAPLVIRTWKRKKHGTKSNHGRVLPGKQAGPDSPERGGPGPGPVPGPGVA